MFDEKEDKFSDQEPRIESLESEIQDLNEELEELKAKAEIHSSKLAEKTHQLVTLFEITAKMTAENDPEEQLKYIAEGIVKARLYRRAIISIFSEGFQRIDVGYGGLTDEEISQHKKSKPMIPRAWEKLLSEKYRVSNSFYISHKERESLGIDTIKSQKLPSSFLGGWHPEDMLFLPLEDSRGKILGVISVDDPFDGCQPTAESLRIAELFAREAAAVIERNQLLKFLRDTEEYLMKLIKTSADIIVTTNAKGKIVLFNSGAERILGYNAEEVQGEDVSILYAHEEQAHTIMKDMRRGNGFVQSLEVIALHKSGEEIPISLSAAILYDKDGSEMGTGGISKDLRPIKELQSRVLELERKAAIKAVVVSLSHHINNYLQAAMTKMQNLEELFHTKSIKCHKEGARSKVEEFLSDIKLNVMRVSELTKALQNPLDKIQVDEYLDGIKYLELPSDMEVNFAAHDHESMKSYGEGFSILVADDEESIRDGISDFLEEHSFDVDRAIDGDQAIEKIEARKIPYEVVISDIKMPGANGYEVFRAAKDRSAETEVILMTAFGYDPGHSVVKASKEGLKARVFKEKPFDLNQILDILRDVVKAKKAE